MVSVVKGQSKKDNVSCQQFNTKFPADRLSENAQLYFNRLPDRFRSTAWK